jgi:hypothetical protein
MVTFGFDATVSFGPHDSEVWRYSIAEETRALAEWTVVEMVMGRKRGMRAQGIQRRPKNVVFLDLVSVSSPDYPME